MNSLATLAVAAVLPFAMADTSKFNQYKSVDDWYVTKQQPTPTQYGHA